VKKILFIVFAGLLCFPELLLAEVKFSDNSYYFALQDAAKKKRKLFVYVYDKNCTSCDEVEKYIFKDKEVSNWYNKFFVNIRVNADTELGKAFCEGKKITNYPAFLFVNPQGEKTLFAEYGFLETYIMIGLAKATSNFDLYMSELYDQYIRGDRKEEFMLLYSFFLDRYNDEPLRYRVMNEYLAGATEEQLLNKAGWKFIQSTCKSVTNKNFIFLENNIRKFAEKYGAETVREFAYKIYKADYERALLNRDEALFYKSAEAYISILSIAEERVSLEQRNLVINSMKLEYYIKSNQRNLYAATAMESVDALFGNDPKKLCEHAFNFYTYVDDPKQLNKAESWAARSVLLSPNYTNLSTYALLLYKTGEDTLSLKMAEKAIRIAAQTGEEDKFSMLKLVELLTEKINGKSAPYPEGKPQQKPDNKFELPVVVAAYQEVIHVVKRGETLSKIAKKYNANPDDIKADNALKGMVVFEGQKLKIKTLVKN
jgi:hypothetical protein